MEQIVSDMQDRIIDVEVRVAGRLVKRNAPHRNLALLSALCKDSFRRRHLQQWLTCAGGPHETEDCAAYFD